MFPGTFRFLSCRSDRLDLLTEGRRFSSCAVSPEPESRSCDLPGSSSSLNVSAVAWGTSAFCSTTSSADRLETFDPLELFELSESDFYRFSSSRANEIPISKSGLISSSAIIYYYTSPKTPKKRRNVTRLIKAGNFRTNLTL